MKHSGHAKRLLEMLSDPEFNCSRCPKPKSSNYYTKIYTIEAKIYASEKARRNYCQKICLPFINMNWNKFEFSKYIGKCPCCVLGSKEALKRTWLKLEEMGMLD